MRIDLALGVATALLAVSAAAAEPSPETVLAKKGDVEVTAGDFMASLAKLPEDQRFSYRADVNRITSNVSSLFISRTLAAEARAQGIDKEPEAQRRLRLAEEALLTQIYLERFEKSIVTPDFEARAREIYKADQSRFTTPETARIKHILVGFQGRTEEEAKRRAGEARAKVVAGENFARVAQEYSNDPNVRNNRGSYSGSYSFLPSEPAAAAHTLPLDTPSPLIRSAEGYHLLVVESRSPAKVTPYEVAKEGIIEAEKAKFRKEVIGKRLASITNSKDIVLYTDDIAALKTEVDRDKLRQMHEDKARELSAEESGAAQTAPPASTH